MVSEEKGPGQIISTHSPTRVLPRKARYYYVTQNRWSSERRAKRMSSERRAKFA